MYFGYGLCMCLRGWMDKLWKDRTKSMCDAEAEAASIIEGEKKLNA